MTAREPYVTYGPKLTQFVRNVDVSMSRQQLTRKALAERAGVSRNTVIGLLEGYTVPQPGTLRRIALALGLPDPT